MTHHYCGHTKIKRRRDEGAELEADALPLDIGSSHDDPDGEDGKTNVAFIG